MCGIAGIITNNSIHFSNELQQMVNSMHHRGPDETGTHHFNNCSLGHCRLRIVDLVSGRQPMLNEENQIGITFNGEIYGYKVLREKLKKFSFKTQSDTEVILALYEEYGTKLLEYLPGIFSFGIWDEKKQQLFCARDRFGEKPFYYAIDQHGAFIFASEIKAITATGLVEPKLNISSISHYLKRLYVNPYETIYTNIHTLPPAHSLIFQDGKIMLNKYWKLPESNSKISLNDAISEFQRMFFKAVRNQLVADVPVAAFLSGGLDSSSIVAAASETLPGINTFSFGFGDSIDEIPYAKETATKYNTNHMVLQAGDYDIVSCLFEMSKVYDEPFADSSNIPTYLISKAASEYSKVVLTGDGGDELLGGYNWYRNINTSKYSSIEYIFFRLLKKMFYHLNNHKLAVSYNKKASEYKAQQIRADVKKQHLNHNVYFSDSEISGLLKIPYLFKEANFDFQYTNTLSDAMNMDLMDYMPGDILVKTDRASMANSLELRAPFLDIDFASFCISLPASLKINSNETKILLRRSMEHLWPEKIKKMPKQGFGAPVHEWLKMEGCRKLTDEYLNDPNKKIYQLLSYEESKKYISTDDYRKWVLLVLSIWFETHSFSI